MTKLMKKTLLSFNEAEMDRVISYPAEDFARKMTPLYRFIQKIRYRKEIKAAKADKEMLMDIRKQIVNNDKFNLPDFLILRRIQSRMMLDDFLLYLLMNTEKEMKFKEGEEE